jgi:NAD(P) transhydrogenase subunit alpha
VEAGAAIGDAWATDVIFKVNPPTEHEIGLLRAAQR